MFILLLLFWQVSPVKPSLTVNLAIQFLGLFIVSLFCHLELARRRPAAGRLTEFFLWVSVGGVLGGLFNALVAPVAFTGYLEYPLTLIAAAFLLPAGGKTTNDRRANVLDAILPVVVAGLTLALVKLPGRGMAGARRDGERRRGEQRLAAAFRLTGVSSA